VGDSKLLVELSHLGRGLESARSARRAKESEELRRRAHRGVLRVVGGSFETLNSVATLHDRCRPQRYAPLALVLFPARRVPSSPLPLTRRPGSDQDEVEQTRRSHPSQQPRVHIRLEQLPSPFIEGEEEEGPAGL
jgi:hypothetical protein